MSAPDKRPSSAKKKKTRTLRKRKSVIKTDDSSVDSVFRTFSGSRRRLSLPITATNNNNEYSRSYGRKLSTVENARPSTSKEKRASTKAYATVSDIFGRTDNTLTPGDDEKLKLSLSSSKRPIADKWKEYAKKVLNNNYEDGQSEDDRHSSDPDDNLDFPSDDDDDHFGGNLSERSLDQQSKISQMSTVVADDGRVEDLVSIFFHESEDEEVDVNEIDELLIQPLKNKQEKFTRRKSIAELLSDTESDEDIPKINRKQIDAIKMPRKEVSTNTQHISSNNFPDKAFSEQFKPPIVSLLPFAADHPSMETGNYKTNQATANILENSYQKNSDKLVQSTTNISKSKSNDDELDDLLKELDF